MDTELSRAVRDEYDLAAYHLIHYAQLDNCAFAAAGGGFGNPPRANDLKKTQFVPLFSK